MIRKVNCDCFCKNQFYGSKRHRAKHPPTKCCIVTMTETAGTPAMLQHSVQMACEASRIFSKDQMPKVRKLGYMMKGEMAKKVEALVESAGRRPVIHQYQNDATSYFWCFTQGLQPARVIHSLFAGGRDWPSTCASGHTIPSTMTRECSTRRSWSCSLGRCSSAPLHGIVMLPQSWPSTH